MFVKNGDATVSDRHQNAVILRRSPTGSPGVAGDKAPWPSKDAVAAPQPRAPRLDAFRVERLSMTIPYCRHGEKPRAHLPASDPSIATPCSMKHCKRAYVHIISSLRQSRHPALRKSGKRKFPISTHFDVCYLYFRAMRGVAACEASMSDRRMASRKSGPVVGGLTLIVALLHGFHCTKIVGSYLFACHCKAPIQFASYVYNSDEVIIAGILVYIAIFFGLCVAAFLALRPHIQLDSEKK